MPSQEVVYAIQELKQCAKGLGDGAPSLKKSAEILRLEEKGYYKALKLQGYAPSKSKTSEKFTSDKKFANVVAQAVYATNATLEKHLDYSTLLPQWKDIFGKVMKF